MSTESLGLEFELPFYTCPWSMSMDAQEVDVGQKHHESKSKDTRTKSSPPRATRRNWRICEEKKKNTIVWACPGGFGYAQLIHNSATIVLTTIVKILSDLYQPLIPGKSDFDLILAIAPIRANDLINFTGRQALVHRSLWLRASSLETYGTCAPQSQPLTDRGIPRAHESLICS